MAGVEEEEAAAAAAAAAAVGRDGDDAQEESTTYQNQIQNAFDVLNRQESVKDQNDSSTGVELRNWYDSDPTLTSPKMITSADNPAINHLDSEAQARRVVCLKKEDNIPGRAILFH